jgi:hypothetical protein
MAKKEPKAKKKTAKKAAPVAQLEQEDLLILQIVVKDFENANLKHQLHQMQAQQVQANAEAAQKKVREINGQLNEKYKLSSDNGDRIDINTGNITRGE